VGGGQPRPRMDGGPKSAAPPPPPRPRAPAAVGVDAPVDGAREGGVGDALDVGVGEREDVVQARVPRLEVAWGGQGEQVEVRGQGCFWKGVVPETTPSMRSSPVRSTTMGSGPGRAPARRSPRLPRSPRMRVCSVNSRRAARWRSAAPRKLGSRRWRGSVSCVTRGLCGSAPATYLGFEGRGARRAVGRCGVSGGNVAAAVGRAAESSAQPGSLLPLPSPAPRPPAAHWRR
jgi:hypothetical protein